MQLEKNNQDIIINTLWLLKNILYQSECEIRYTVMSKIPLELIKHYVSNNETPFFQEQTLGILRNLFCGTQADVEYIMHRLGWDKFVILIMNTLNSSICVIEQALYVIVNICTGTSSVKNMLISNMHLMNSIKKLLVKILLPLDQI